MTDEISPMGSGSLVTASETSVTLKSGGPPSRATVEFQDDADVVVTPHDVPSWGEDSDGQVITLLVAADGLSATIIPKGIGKANLTVTTLRQDESKVQVHGVVSVVGGEPTHAAIHWTSAELPNRVPVARLEKPASPAPTGLWDQTWIDQDTSETVPFSRARFSLRKLTTPLWTHNGHHRLRYMAVSLAAVVVVGVGYVFLSYEFRSLPGAKSLSSVVSAFKGGKSTTDENVLYEPPAQGVYTLRGEGSERISFPPNSMSDGEIMPATVTYIRQGCWRWHLDYNTAHWDEYDFCPKVDGLVQAANRNYQSWDFGTLKVTNLANFICPSNTVVLTDSPVSGQVLDWTCNGTNTSVKGTTTAKVVTHVFGAVNLSIGKTPVKAIHEVQKTTLSGGQKGTVIEDWWFSAKSGLPIRVERQIKILTASPLGTITYTESGSWQMTSLTPHT